MIEAVASAVLIGAALSLAASPILYQGWKHRRRYERIQQTPVASSTDVDSEQPVLLSGTVRGESDQITAPVSGETALLTAWDACRWVKDSSRYWFPEVYRVESTDLVVETDDADVRVPAMKETTTVDNFQDFFHVPNVATGVDVETVDVEAERFETELSVAPSEEPPPRVQRLVERLDLPEQPQKRELIPITKTEGTRRFREFTVTEGTELTIRARIQSQSVGGVVDVAEPDDAPILVTDLSPAELRRRYRWGYWKRFHLFVGIIVLVSAFSGLAVWL